MALLHDNKGATIQIVALLHDNKGATIQIVALLHGNKGATIQIVALLHDYKGATIQIVALLHDNKSATIKIAVLLHDNFAPQSKFQSKNMTQLTKISYLCTVVQQIKQIKTKNNYEKTKIRNPARCAHIRGGGKSYANDIAAANADGVTIYYNYINNQTELEVTYQGSFYTSKPYTDKVVIPESVTYEGETYSVTSIGKDAFNYCSSLTEVTIPSSVTSIGWAAFSKCSLTKVTIPNSVVSIDIGAFCYCPNLTEVTIPNSVTSIGDNAFGNCPNLTEVTISSNVTSISDYTFQSCRSLAKVHIPNSVTSIGERAFFFCSSLTELTIGNSVTSIGNDAFEGCSSLTELTIPNSVTTIGQFAFRGCSGLTEVTIGNSVTSIGKRTFRDCSSLTTLYSLNPTPPSAIDYVGDSAFDDNHYMTVDVYVPQEALEAYRSADVWKEFKKLQDFEYNAVEEVSTASKQIQSANGQITVTGLTDGTTVDVYDLSGRQIGTAVSTNGQTIINPNLAPGSIAIVKIGDRSIKITMK